MRLPIAFLILPAIFAVAGCDDTKSFADLTCADVADSAIGISKGAMITLDNRTLTSKDDKRIVCHGTGGFHDGSQKLVRFQAFINDDGKEIIRYDTDEYQAAQEAKERQDDEQEIQQESQEVSQAYQAAVQPIINDINNNN